MRHRAITHSFGRRSGPKKALIRGLVYSLVEHGRIKTTVTKAKELRRHVEKAITLGKKGTVHARRLLLERFPNQQTVSTLMDDLGKRFKTRNGGYTRIIKIGSRVGDAAEMAFIEFVDYKPDLTVAEDTVSTAGAETKQAKSATKAKTKAKTKTAKTKKKVAKKTKAKSK